MVHTSRPHRWVKYGDNEYSGCEHCGVVWRTPEAEPGGPCEDPKQGSTEELMAEGMRIIRSMAELDNA